MRIKTRAFFTIIFVVLCCYITTLIFPTQYNVNVTVEGSPAAQSNSGTVVSGTATSTTQPSQTTTQAADTKSDADTDADTTVKQSDNNADASEDKDSSEDTQKTDGNKMPETTKEIIDQYTLLLDKMKAEEPAYKKKEFQSLPEEYRNLGSIANLILELAAGYMTTEEECEEVVREKNAGTINNEMPIYGSSKGCVLTDYDAVSWAKCEDLGDGTYKISFSLKEEKDCEPTSADTLVPTSAHGAVMSPLSKNDIQTEVDKVTSSVPGLNVNSFELTYRECEFICIYDPATDQVSSITHHIVIDIAVDIDMFVANINGTARLLNEMLIYDITW